MRSAFSGRLRPRNSRQEASMHALQNVFEILFSEMGLVESGCKQKYSRRAASGQILQQLRGKCFKDKIL
jgi:hypothetical protein